MSENIMPYMYLLGPAAFNVIYAAIRIYNKKRGASVEVGKYGFSIWKHIVFFNRSMDSENRRTVRIVVDILLVWAIIMPALVYLVAKLNS